MVRRLGISLLIPFVLSAAMLGSFDARELVKVPNLVAHYQHHLSDHGQSEMTLWDFLASHFQSGAAHDDEHANLPLFSGTASAWLFLPLIDIRSDEHYLFHIVLRPIRWSELQIPASCAANSVFQPPRLI